MHYGEGRALNSFDLRVEQGSNVQFEWRDYTSRSPYITGPRLTVRDGKLQLPGGITQDLPLGEWVHFEIIAEMSEPNGSRWRLGVTLPDGDPPGFRNLVFRDLPFANAECYKVNWIGFTSNTDKFSNKSNEIA